MSYERFRCTKPQGMFKDFAENYEHKKIDFVKIDSTYAEIYYNEARVGHLENHATHFIVEVYYKRIKVGKNHKKHIKRFIRDYCAWHQYEQYSYESLERRGMKAQG